MDRSRIYMSTPKRQINIIKLTIIIVQENIIPKPTYELGPGI